MAAVIAASGAVFLHSGAADPLVAAAAERVADLTGSAPEPAAKPEASPSRTARVSWNWDIGAPTWSANKPQPSQLRPRISIDPKSPTRPDSPTQPWEPAGTPPDDGWPFWYGTYATNPKVPMEVRRDCPQFYGQNGVIPMTAKAAGKGRATLTWWDSGDPNTRLYQVDVFKRTGGDAITSTTYPAKKPRGCQEVTVAINGLASGQEYEFWLETIDDDPIDKGKGNTVRLSRGRTEQILIP